MTRNTSDDRTLDETLEETFPASDAPANTVETGIHAGAPPEPDAPVARDNPQAHRFELTVEGQTAFLAYERKDGALALVHTEVPTGLRGRHLGERLVDAAVAAAHEEHLRLVVVCPFARAYLQRRRG
jgi:predicted GNAT family acetyltransferase